MSEADEYGPGGRFAEGPNTEPMRDEEETELQIGPIDRKLPTPAIEVNHHQWTDEFTRLPDGGMLIHVIDLVAVGRGDMEIVQPHHTLEFSKDAWERFKGRVANDGERPVQIQPARPTIFGPNGDQPL